jgi:type IX secretion system PorP/SprF family membrane protein
MKKITLLYIFLLAMLVSNKILAQFIPQTQQGLMNLGLSNPAYMCMDKEKFYGSVSHQRATPAIDGMPETSFLNLQFKPKNLGIGMIVWHDKIGNFSNTLFQAGASYEVQLNKNSDLSFGLYGGFIRYTFDMNRAVFANPDDPIKSIGINGNAIPLDFGLYYENRSKRGALYAMAAMKKVFPYQGVGVSDFPMMFTGMIGAKGKVIGDDFQVNTALEIRKETTLSANLHGMLIYQDILSLGLVLRAEDLKPLSTFGFQAGCRLMNPEEDNCSLKLNMAFFFPSAGQLVSRNASTIAEIGISVTMPKKGWQR